MARANGRRVPPGPGGAFVFFSVGFFPLLPDFPGDVVLHRTQIPRYIYTRRPRPGRTPGRPSSSPPAATPTRSSSTPTVLELEPSGLDMLLGDRDRTRPRRTRRPPTTTQASSLAALSVLAVRILGLAEQHQRGSDEGAGVRRQGRLLQARVAPGRLRGANS